MEALVNDLGRDVEIGVGHTKPRKGQRIYRVTLGDDADMVNH